MKISQAIKRLQKLKEKHRDVDFRAYQYEGCDPFIVKDDGGIAFYEKGPSMSALGGILEECVTVEGGG